MRLNQFARVTRSVQTDPALLAIDYLIEQQEADGADVFGMLNKIHRDTSEPNKPLGQDNG